MPVLGRPTLKRYFETGKNLSNQALFALTDSFVHLSATTAQELPSQFAINEITVSGAVSAGDADIREGFQASTAFFTGLVSHGSASTSGKFVLTQEGTANATAQIALLPNSSNVVGLGVRVIRNSSGAAGGTQISIGNAVVSDYFGSVVVSGTGVFKLTSVCAPRLQGTSGAVYAAGITASAGSSFVPYVEYYTTVSAPQTNVISEITSFVSAIGNMTTGGGLLAAFDGNTSQIRTSGARVVSTVRGFVGQAWNAPKKIARAIVYDPSDDGLESGGLNVIMRLRGNNTNDITTAVVLASINATFVSPTTAYSLVETDIDLTNAYSYHWVDLSAAANGNFNVAEIRLWELT